MKHYSLCPLCIGVSGLWLGLSALVAWGLAPHAFLLPVALLMGGSVVGIALQMPSFKWKTATTAIGMFLAYLLVSNLSKKVVLVEFAVLLSIAVILFSRKDAVEKQNVFDLEEKMKQCC